MKARCLVLSALLGAFTVAHAQPAATNPADHAAHHPAGTQAAVQYLSEGEVRKVDLAQGKVTLRHGPLPNLDMPAMTMVFTATDKKLLDGLKEGDKVRFNADKKNGSYVVTALQAVR